MPRSESRCARPGSWTTPTKAKRLIENLGRRLDRDEPGVAASILEGIDQIVTVTKLALPMELRRSLACTTITENMNGTVRRVCHNVKRWRDASMALRWTAAGMMEAAKGFRRLKACKQLPALRAALNAHNAKPAPVEEKSKAAWHPNPAAPARRISTARGTSPSCRFKYFMIENCKQTALDHINPNQTL